MLFLPGLIVCFLGCSVALASEETFRAGIVGVSTAEGDLRKYVPFILEAAKLNVDIVVLPSPLSFSTRSSIDSSCGIDNYDELVEILSEASQQAGLYVVAHLLEKTRCQGKYELVRSNLVFGRDGHVEAVYRKPVNTVANCTAPATEIGSFTTDFGVQFGLMMEEDLVLQKVEGLGLKNFVVAGSYASDIPFLSAPQFASSWAFTNEVNLVSSSGAFAGRSGSQERSEAGLRIADLKKVMPEDHSTTPPVVTSSQKVFPSEDLSQYIIKPLDVAASAGGYRETVCHDGFCCEFYVKASFDAKLDSMNYGLAAFAGVRQYGKHNIGARACAVFACAALYKRTCAIGSKSNSTNVIFEKISITANFTSDTTQYPIILTTGSQIQPNKFNFETKGNENEKQVTIEVSAEDLLNFGVLGRDFSKDSEGFFVVEEEFLSFNDEMKELFDYLWIRLRILMFVVSIYFLEMM